MKKIIKRRALLISMGSDVKNYKVKIIIAGEPGAGKSFLAQTTDVCIASRSIGASIGKITEIFQDSSCEMMLLTWAITKGRPKESTHLKHAQAAIIVCDLTKPNTVKLTPKWAKKILNIVGDIPLFFAANNADLGTSKSLNRFQKVASKFKSPSFPILSEDRESAKALFRIVAKVLSEDLMDRERMETTGIIPSVHMGTSIHYP